jgi:hypothetical protein
MNPEAFIASVSLALLVSMVLIYELGRQIGRAQIRRDPKGLAKGIGAAEGSVFGLLGLIIAFTFSGAGNRLEARRALITQEANDIGTAYLRLDLLAADDKMELREKFRKYAELRASPPTIDSVTAADDWYRQTAEMLRTIWAVSVVASQRPEADPDARKLLLPALNAMIDITSTRKRATRDHPPLAIYLLLAGLSLLGALMIGYAAADNDRRNWLHPISFAIITSLAVLLILDLEFPRVGLIKIDSSDAAILDAREEMNSP